MDHEIIGTSADAVTLTVTTVAARASSRVDAAAQGTSSLSECASESIHASMRSFSRSLSSQTLSWYRMVIEPPPDP